MTDTACNAAGIAAHSRTQQKEGCTVQNGPDRCLTTGAAIMLIGIGIARLVVAITDGNAEGIFTGSISAIALWAIAGMVFYLDHGDKRTAQQPRRGTNVVPFRQTRGRARTGTNG